MIDYLYIDSKCNLCSNYEIRYAGNIAVISGCQKGLEIDKKIWEHCEGFEKKNRNGDVKWQL